MSIHATEIAATQTAPELLHTLATSPDPEVTRSLNDVVLILFPSLNPDGHVITVDWYRKWRGSEFEGAAMPWLYHKYVGHDINRDAFMMNMAENRTIADFFYRRWHPQVFLTMHQMGPRGARYFVPPNLDPIDRNYDPLIGAPPACWATPWRWRSKKTADRACCRTRSTITTGPVTKISAPLGHNTVSLLTEAASVRIASPITVDADQLTGGRGFPDDQPFNDVSQSVARRRVDAAQHRRTTTCRRRAVDRRVGAIPRRDRRNFYRMGKKQVELERRAARSRSSSRRSIRSARRAQAGTTAP